MSHSAIHWIGASSFGGVDDPSDSATGRVADSATGRDKGAASEVLDSAWRVEAGSCGAVAMVQVSIMRSALSSSSSPPRTRCASAPSARTRCASSRFFLRQSRTQWPATPQYLHVSFDVPGFPAPRAELPLPRPRGLPPPRPVWLEDPPPSCRRIRENHSSSVRSSFPACLASGFSASCRSSAVLRRPMSSSMGSLSRSSRVSIEHAICENLVGTTERNLRIVSGSVMVTPSTPSCDTSDDIRMAKSSMFSPSPNLMASYCFLSAVAFASRTRVSPTRIVLIASHASLAVFFDASVEIISGGTASSTYSSAARSVSRSSVPSCTADQTRRASSFTCMSSAQSA